jgi:hypothetical protein
MSVRCPRCGREDDGSSYACPHCFTVLHPELEHPSEPKKVDPFRDYQPGPVGRAVRRLGRRLRGRREPDTDPGAPAFPGGEGSPGIGGAAGAAGGRAAGAAGGRAAGGGGRQVNPYAPGAAGVIAHEPPRRPLGQPDPPTYLWQSILATLFCCMPPGIVAIVYAALTISALGHGNWHEAKVNSERARLWLGVAFMGWVVLLILTLVMILSGGGRLVTIHCY